MHYPAVNTANIVIEFRLTDLGNHIVESICINNNALFFIFVLASERLMKVYQIVNSENVRWLYA